MSNTFKDFSALKKIKPQNPPAPKEQPKVEVSYENKLLNSATTSQDYFSSLLGNKKATNNKAEKSKQQHTIVTPGTIARVREEQAELAYRQALKSFEMEVDNLGIQVKEYADMVEDFAHDLVDAQAERDEALKAKENSESALAAANDELAKLRKEIAEEKAKPRIDEKLLTEVSEKDKEIEQLKTLLIEAQQTSLSSSVLLDKPSGIGEKFAGEIREHILETLKLSLDAAERSGQERRSRILEAVLCSNIPSGELERRRNELKQLIIEEGNAINESTIAKLERLGFRYISGKNHHKFEWAGHRYIVSKTPSDHRSAQNSAADICNRIF